jgi:AraC-like DNA-binding protein
MASRGYRSRIRAWRLGQSGFLSLCIDHGVARFPSWRTYATLTVPLLSGFDACEGRRKREFGLGSAHVLWEPGQRECVWPRPGSHLMGLAIDSSLLKSHREALEGSWGEPPRALPPRVRTTKPSGRSLLTYLYRVWRELVQPESPLHSSDFVPEVEYTVARMLVEATLAGEAPDRRDAGAATARRAEEWVAAHLDRPVSLAELARAIGVSTRTLSRVFRERHGMGPVAFLRRLRFEAARRDLTDADSEQTCVTQVAMRYGFNHFGRFSVEYRREFGESPSETLHCWDRARCVTGVGPGARNVSDGDSPKSLR